MKAKTRTDSEKKIIQRKKTTPQKTEKKSFSAPKKAQANLQKAKSSQSNQKSKSKQNHSKKQQIQKKKSLPKVKVYSLGGLNEIGKNITAFECENDIIIVDCGIGFPNDDMLGVDLVIPDFTHIQK